MDDPSVSAALKIDQLLEAHLGKEQLKPNPTIRDEVFVRRVYLGIIGRIPTIAESERFLKSGDADKHSSLISELLKNDAGYTAVYPASFFNNSLIKLECLSASPDFRNLSLSAIVGIRPIIPR